MASETRQLGSCRVTRGIRVEVAPLYLPDQSDPDAHKFVFTYRVRLVNEGDVTAQLTARHWIIVDADGERHEVRGDGVVGRHPNLPPGQGFEYTSFCPLSTPWGTMEGAYTFETEQGERFDVEIGRFYLVMPDEHAADEHQPRP